MTTVNSTTPIADLRRAHKSYLQSEKRVEKERAKREKKNKKRDRPSFYFITDEMVAFYKLQQMIAEQFGRLNGWTLIKKYFLPGAIRHIGRHQDHAPPSPMPSLDPPGGLNYKMAWMGSAFCYCDQQGCNSAIVGQPYKNRTLEECRPLLDACAAQYKLQWHAPPIPSATFDPDKKLFIVMTLPDHEMVWLPDQQIS